MAIKKGQKVRVTANGGLRGRHLANDKAKVVTTRPDNYVMRADNVSPDGKWVRSGTAWYLAKYLSTDVGSAGGGGGRPEDKRLRRPKDSVAAARRWKTCRVGMCLYTVQEWMGGLHGIPWAEAAWNASKQKHRRDKNPPAGVPVFWHNPKSKYGHIALSVGHGRVRSTDWPSRNRVGEVDIDTMTRRWGLRYLGWTGDMPPGGDIPGVKN